MVSQFTTDPPLVDGSVPMKASSGLPTMESAPFISHNVLTHNRWFFGWVHPTGCKSRKTLRKYKARSFRFEYGYRYGSGELDQKSHKILGIEKLDDSDNPTWGIAVENLAPGRIYELTFSVKSTHGSEMKSPFVQYTVND
jgi:hypothetical protein